MDTNGGGRARKLDSEVEDGDKRRGGLRWPGREAIEFPQMSELPEFQVIDRACRLGGNGAPLAASLVTR